MILKLSCKCCICSLKCLQNFIDLIKTNKFTRCICSLYFYPSDLIKLSKDKNGYVKLNDSFKKALKESMLSHCMFCDALNLSLLNESHVGYILLYTDEVLSNKAGMNIDFFKKFYHYCCRVCYSELSKAGKLLIDKNINCNDCNSGSHTLKSIQISTNANMKDDNCLIY